MKENFKQEDIDKLIRQQNFLDDVNLWPDAYEEQYDLVEVEYVCDEIKHIKLPTKLFTNILAWSRPDLLKYLPYKMKLSKLERPKDNYYLQESHYLGLNDKDELILCLDPNVEHSIVSLLWVMMHEFRHKIQYLNKNIYSCLYNSNYDKWKAYYNKDENLINHVFHEILPYEVDANVFACEILKIEYPGSKFEITDYTLRTLDSVD